MLKTVLTCVLFGLWGELAQADVRLANIFGDHMVLQRQQAIPVWGWANAGERVRVALHHQSSGATADAQGRWRVLLKPEAGGGPYTLVVQGANLLIVKDVVLGDVWLASGQSNMEWSVAQSDNAAAELAQSDLSRIRHVKIPKSVAFRAAQDIGVAQWKRSEAQSAGEFTAVGYFFARALLRETGVPIGIVNASWGGTNIETWISPAALATQPDLAMDSMPADAQTSRLRYAQKMEAVVQAWQHSALDGSGASSQWKKPDFDDQNWVTLKAPQYWEEQGLADFDGVVWYRRDVYLNDAQAAQAAVLELGTVDDCDETFVNGRPVGNICQWDAQRRYDLPEGLLHAGRNLIAVRVLDNGGGGGFYGDAAAMKLRLGSESIALSGTWKARVESYLDKGDPSPNDLPALLFNSMVSPLTGFPIKGVIWYQGESNVPRAQQYAQMFPLLISDWRAQWRQPHLPFYFVQLASFLPLQDNSLKGSDWAELREAQRQTLKLPQTGMVVATDVGDANSIHPLNKQAVGARLARLALKNDYGKGKIVASGPSYRSMRVRGSRVEISFSDVGRGLVLARGQAVINGFTVADESRQFLPAQARIRGNKVIVWRSGVTHPVAVRFGWVDNPQEDNLFNREGLPASPFRTDDWPGLTDGVKYKF